MNIIIENPESLEFFTGEGLWSKNVTEGKTLPRYPARFPCRQTGIRRQVQHHWLISPTPASSSTSTTAKAKATLKPPEPVQTGLFSRWGKILNFAKRLDGACFNALSDHPPR